jgi:SAM-dependent methyltransferase
VTEYALAHGGDATERDRLALLERFHGPLTVAHLQDVVRPGWRCLEAGAGAGGMTRWLAERVVPGGSVLAVDLETHWLSPLRSDVVDVRTLDITTDPLPAAAFDLVLARMLLLHLADPLAACRRLVATARDGATLLLQEADFDAVHLDGASTLEAEGLQTMNETMRASGVDLTLGSRLAAIVETAGAELETVDRRPSPGQGGGLAARICALTTERLRTRALCAGTSREAIDAAIDALRDSSRTFTGPTQWIVRAHV